ncbi:MAG: DUF389 domain-containing protein [Chitinivibrionales bacterium]
MSNEQKRQDRNHNKQKYQFNIEPQAKFNIVFVTLMGSSGTLAAVAYPVNSVPILIGSMVIAPVMPPLVLTSIGLANANFSSALKGLAIAVAGLTIAFACAVVTTWLLNATGVSTAQAKTSQLLIERVNPGWYSVVAAFAAGIAGALAVSHQKQDTLVGVVASIALVPTVAAAGISALSRDWKSVTGGLLMLLLNICMIVFMGWLVFNFFSRKGE